MRSRRQCSQDLTRWRQCRKNATSSCPQEITRVDKVCVLGSHSGNTYYQKWRYNLGCTCNVERILGQKASSFKPASSMWYINEPQFRENH
ncbi:hypothetical protein BN2476_230014 [Paraburkholderia piptadeniae]|uniref:Uncharacterized protein n=1 Tax=Paraburkholderia piptadeniae TaxID=1701573 RepID=A0A1N7RWH6_9BURK|nr:hypothetical protein BN2476_230014 [Paraburkholderia piptadeniae]